MSKNIDPEQFLAGFPPDMRSIAQALREVVQTQVPHVQEAVYVGWRLIGYRADHGSANVYFAYVAPTTEYVSLGFEWGILVADPEGILEGNGRQVRYARFRQLEDIRPKLLAPLISHALEIAAMSKDEKQQRFIERDARLDALKSQGGISE